ncbi:hypothetical protein [Aquimarina sp. AU474]|uniref:hypothetical protein n=1 Tax=Aquimarina sp. AU474 TaxID=2108529 RepID=UPI000D688DC7|nr:hypothetical protein [Aquimarina sp. AU474]
MDVMQTVEVIEKILLAIIGIIVIFDIYLYVNDTDGDTISNILKNWVNDRFFFITYLWGVLAGHFFLGAKNSIVTNTAWSLVIVLFIAVLLFISGMYFKQRIRPKGQIVLLVLGITIGHFFWSLN